MAKNGGLPSDEPASTPQDLQQVAGGRYRIYALSVIGSRALPDVRDGLKPVQRRILATMWGQRLTATGRFRKCAKVVGDVMGALHPHGDSSIYEALVRMAQPFASRVPLIEGAGNFGSLDGDPPAAMRYTECRLASAAEDVLAELGPEIVPHRPSYDGARSEPVVLPTRLPLLLVNGSIGIAVGVATSIPPHNPVELLEGLIALGDDPEIDGKQLAELIPGPDFPTGGIILESREHLLRIQEKGHGAVRVRAEVREAGERRNIRTLHITSIPYGVDKSELVERLAELAADRSLAALVEVRDLSADDVRIQLDLRRDADPEQVLEYLYRRTPLMASFPVNLTCLRFDRAASGVPERVGLKRLLLDFLDFRRDVVTSRGEEERRRLGKRLHVLEGFAQAFDALDRILRIIRTSDGKADAARRIRAELPLDEEQTEAILEMRLHRLARLEIRLVREEMEKRRRRVGELGALLGNPAAIRLQVRRELVELRDRYREREPRRTRIQEPGHVRELDEEELMADEDAVVILSRDGWLKRQRDVKQGALRMRDGDAVLAYAAGSTRAPLVLFSSLGVAYTTRIARAPATSGYGVPVQTLFQMGDGESIVSMLSLDRRAVGDLVERRGEALPVHALAVTRGGYALRFLLGPLRESSKRTGRRIARFRTGDSLLGVVPAESDETLLLATSRGRALLTAVEEVNLLNGPGIGVRVIKLALRDEVLGFRTASRDEPLVMVTPGGQRRKISAGRFPAGTRGRVGQLVNKAGFARVEAAPRIPELRAP